MNRFYRFVALAVILMVLGCVRGPRPQYPGGAQYGMASWYGRDFQGRPTASGEIFDMYGYTAAHRSLPFGTRVRVTNEANGRSVVVRINDRGPWVEGRILDLSYAAAKQLGMLEAGVIRVRLEVLR
ncbi:MAG TPA: septal ring lytic transglycosylase RlpA family protein [bacterium]|nr:septal ring lytic transglycosylase RlpA family protein [bacterium]